MPDGFFPDVSEFQANIDWPAVAAFTQVAIARVYNGYRPDNAWAKGRQAAMRASGLARRGFYLFLVSDVDPIVQARSFLSAVGHVQPDEFLMVDSEEVPWHPWAAGQQRAWTQLVCDVLRRTTGLPPVVYSDVNTLRQMGGPLPGYPLIVAAYGVPEPVSWPHLAWQYTDGRYTSGPYQPIPVPGVGYCDISVFHGTLADFDRALGLGQGAVTVATPTTAPHGPAGPEEELMSRVAYDPISGGSWVTDTSGAVFAYDGAPYLGGTNTHPDWDASADGHTVVGIAAWRGDSSDNGGNGYVVVSHWPETPDSPYRQYRFPRSGIYAK